MKTEISRAGDETGIFLHLFISKKLFGIFMIFENIPTSNTVKRISIQCSIIETDKLEFPQTGWRAFSSGKAEYILRIL